MRKDICMIMAVVLLSQVVTAQVNGFVKAYDSLHQVFSHYFPYTKWKGIRWDEVNQQIRPQILAAAVSGDSVAFYIALKSYFDHTHDGHVGFRHGWQSVQDQARYRQIGGSYGFAAVRLDDGRVVARIVNPGSPAALAGMQFGATLLEVNDTPVDQVLDTIPVLWAEMIPATLEFKQINQERLIGRAPVEGSMKVRFLNRGSSVALTATLTAVDDQYLTYNQTSMHPVEPEPGVFSRIIQPSGYGYIKMNNEGGDSALLKKEYNDFKDALTGFGQQGVRGVVLDFRVNCGGDDALAAAIAGFFHPDTAFYEFWTLYNPTSDSIEIWPDRIAHYDPLTLNPVYRPAYPPGALYTEPQSVYYDKPVVVMVNPRNISSGEGVPMMLQKLKRAKVVSFYGSNGSFGLCSLEYNLFPPPDGLKVSFEFGQSVDRQMKVQIDSDSTMTGGVIPNIRVPLNDTVIDQLYLDSIDVELNYAVKVLNSIMGNGERQGAGTGLLLEQNVPNPFNGITRISYFLPSDALVELVFCDITGRALQTLVYRHEKAGSHTVTFNGSGYTKGLYFFRLKAGNSEVARKCIID
ncbi:MAG: T9SS type A sorting domain-containing protein [Bacteroidales bacterium]|nr:T9SS type A sorting domain-containing protein [Bacteroidales bacterium]